MNLDALVNELQDSKNRVFADEIFAQLDLLDKAKADLLAAKSEHKERFNDDSHDLIAEREKYKSFNDGFVEDHRNLIKDLKRRLKKQLDELKKDYKEEYKHVQSIPKHTERKLRDYYASRIEKYKDDQAAGVPGAAEEKERFIVGFASFKEKELRLAKEGSVEKLAQIKAEYDASVGEITEKFTKLIDEKNEKHQRMIADKVKAKNKQQIKQLDLQIKQNNNSLSVPGRRG